MRSKLSVFVVLMLSLFAVPAFAQQATASEVVLDASKAGKPEGATARYVVIEQAGGGSYVFDNGQCHVEMVWSNTGIVHERMFGTTRWSGLPGGAKHTIADGSVATATSGEFTWSYLPREVGQVTVSMDYDHSPTCEGNVSVGGIFAAFKVRLPIYAFWADGQPITCDAGSGCRYVINYKQASVRGTLEGKVFPDTPLATGLPYFKSIGKYTVDLEKTRGPGGAKPVRVEPARSQEIFTPFVYFTIVFERPATKPARSRK